MVLVVIALSGVVGSAFSNNFNSGNSPSQRAQDLLALRFPAQAGDTADVVIHTTGQVNDAANAATINRLVDALVPLSNVTSVRSPLSSGAEHQVSADGHTAFAVVQFDKTTPDLKTSHTKELIRVAKSFAHPGLAESAVAGHHEVQIDLGIFVFAVIQIEQFHSFADPTLTAATLAVTTAVGDPSCHRRQRVHERDECSVNAAVRVPPSASSTSQSSHSVRSPSLARSTTARRLRPMSRWISNDRPSTLPPLSRGLRRKSRRGACRIRPSANPYLCRQAKRARRVRRSRCKGRWCGPSARERCRPHGEYILRRNFSGRS